MQGSIDTFLKDTEIRFHNAVIDEVTSEEVESSKFLKTMSVDLAGGDAQIWIEFVKDHRKSIIQNELQAFFQGTYDLTSLNKYIKECRSDEFCIFLIDTFKSIESE